MKITILDDYQNVIEKLDCFNLLKGQDIQIVHETEKNHIALAAKIRYTEILILTRERTEITEELLQNLSKLKLISQTGKISNHLKLEICNKYKVAVAEGTGSPIAPAELTWALLMNVVRKIPESIEGMKSGKWQVNLGSSIHGKTIGIWGYGKIGQQIAQYAKAFGAKVLVWGSESSRNKAIEDGFEKANSKGFFFANADIITLHLRLTDSTYGIVKQTDLEMMKDNSCIINTARSELIEKGALLEVLSNRKQLLAGIDVYEEEPVYDINYKLLKMENVICTPHLGYVEKNGYELYFGKAFENAMNFIGGSPTNIANPQVLK